MEKLLSLEEEPGGSRPDRIAALSGPQERVQRRIVQQIVDNVSLLPTLDYLAPQTVEHLPDILHFLRALSLDPEQAIEVLKILPVDVPRRTSVREPQLASPRCSGLRSRTSTFQLLVVVELVEVFPVFSQDSIAP